MNQRIPRRRLLLRALSGTGVELASLRQLPAHPMDPEQVFGSAYGPYLIEHFTQIGATGVRLSYLLSTWNPYTVVRMVSNFSLGAPWPAHVEAERTRKRPEQPCGRFGRLCRHR